MRRSLVLSISLLIIVGCARPGRDTPPPKAGGEPVPEVNGGLEHGAARDKFTANLTVEAMARGEGFYSEEHDDFAGVSEVDALEAKIYLKSFMAGADAAIGSDSSKLAFSRACEHGKRIVIGAVGDVLLHQPLAEQGMRRKDFATLWSGVAEELKLPNLMYANLEGPTAGPLTASGKVISDPGYFDRVAYTSYPQFNYNPALVSDLRDSGVDVVSTANNHAMDRRSLGADRTIEALKKAGLPFAGTRTSAEAARVSAEKTDWTVVTEKDGFKIGWVSCTFSTNGIPDPKRQVLLCFGQRSIVLDQIRRLKADPSIDAVIVTPHWGVEYTHTPGADQKALAKDMIEAGALIVFGDHPHVLQPVDRIEASDGHEGYVIYSLGNFVSGQKGVDKRTSAMIFVGLTKNQNGEVFVNGARHLPLAMMYGANGLSVKPAKGNFEEGRVLANRVLSRSVEIEPGAPIVTNPGCR